MKKLDKESWFRTGLEILEEEGFLKITIDNLCRTLKVTKGSFYHHFKNMEGYVEALMKYWVDKNTMLLMAKADKEKDPQKKMEVLYKAVFTRPHKSEQVIRGWSFCQDTVKKYMDEVDNTRIAYTARLKEFMGENADIAKRSAVLEYACLIGVQQLYPDISAQEQAELYELLAKK